MTKHPSALTRIGALAEHLAGFTAALEAAGYTPLTVAGYSMSVAHFAQWTRQQGETPSDWSAATLDRFAAHRCRCPGARRRQRISRKYVQRVRRFLGYLARQGVIESRTAAPRIAPLPAFSDWLIQHRGSSPRTVERYVSVLSRLLPAAGTDSTTFTAMQIRQLVLRQVRCRSVSYAHHVVTALRAYLRFLAAQGQCPAGLHQAIPKIAQWRLSTLPRYVSPEQIARLVGACDPATTIGLRDRAVVLLLARLGLRAGDIVRLRLADIDWSAATLTVCGKGRREVRLPLPQDAGDAVLAYLEHGRPRIAIDRVFLCSRAPHRSFPSSGVVSSIVSAALRRAGIDRPPSRGANLLRHSAATAMLRAGASLDAVSSLLRHRSLDMTAYYAKVDLSMLSSVAQPWPEGVSC